MKLTNEIRDRMINNIITAKFKNDRSLLASDLIHWSVAVYEEAVDVKRINKCPIEWFAVEPSFTVYCNGNYVTAILPEPRMIPYYIRNKGLRFALEHPKTQGWMLLRDRTKVIELAEKELRSELSKVLYSVTTDKRLIEIWPEATKWLPSPLSVYLPANVDVNKLRSLLKPL